MSRALEHLERKSSRIAWALGPIAFVQFRDMETTGVSMSLFFAAMSLAPWRDLSVL
jgi:hypothetical protein